MGAKTKIQTQIETELRPALKALEKEHDAQKAKIQDVITQLSDALRATNLAAIESLRDTLKDHQVGPYARLATQTRLLLAEVKKLKPADGGDDSKRIQEFAAALGKFETKLNSNFEGIKKMEAMANSALSRGATRSEWQDMEGYLNAQLEAARLHLKAMEQLDQLTRDAVDARDQKDLDYALEKNKERSKWKPTQKEIQDKFSKFCAKCESGALGKDLADQLARDRGKFKKIVDELADLNRKMDDLQNLIRLAYISKVDHKALARALKITDPKAVDRLKLALRPEGDDRMRALNALQNDFKLKFSPKDIETLMKAKVK